MDIFSDIEYIVNYNKDENKIEFYDLNHDIKTNTILLNSNSETSPLIYGFFVQKLDSIFVLKNRDNIISLINSKSEIINTCTIKDSIYKSSLYEINATKQNPILYNKGKIYVTNNKFSSIEDFFDSHTEVIIDINNSPPKVTNQTGEYPQAYLEGKYYHLIGTMVSKTINNKNEIVFSFPIDHYIYIYNDSSFLAKYLIKSKFIKGFIEYPKTKLRDLQYANQYSSELNTYFSILFDSYRNVYYRIVLHGQNYFNEDNSVNQFVSKPWSIIILNRDFEILNEVVFPPKKYNFTDILVTKRGILISNNNIFNPHLDENKLSFTLFKLTVDSEK